MSGFSVHRTRVHFTARLMLGLCAAGWMPSPQGRCESPKETVFRHVTVIPMTGNQKYRDQDVVVRGEVISMIAPSGSQPLPEDARVIDGTSKFLMPGLGEMHAHLPEPSQPEQYMRTVLSLYVLTGVTTVRCMRGFPNHLVARQRIASGELLGPSLFLAGPGLGSESVKSPEDGAQQVIAQHTTGWDMIKIFPGLTRPEYDAIMLTARRLGMRTGGHIPDDVGVLHAFEMGQESIEHLDGYWQVLGFEKPVPDSALEQMAIETRTAGAWNAPTMSVFHFDLGLDPLNETLANPEMEYLPSFQINDWVKLFNEHVSKEHPPLDVSKIVQINRERFLKKLNDVGSPLLLGTDSPNLFNVPGFSVFLELKDMQASGLSPYDVLVTGTRNVGTYLHENVGTVTVGARADLILLDADPLDDVANMRKQEGVMLHGRWIDKGEIASRLKAIHDLPGNYRINLAPSTRQQ